MSSKLPSVVATALAGGARDEAIEGFVKAIGSLHDPTDSAGDDDAISVISKEARAWLATYSFETDWTVSSCFL